MIATCKSKRTLDIVGTYVRKVYKIKRSNTDKPREKEQVPKIHGLKEKSGWLTMDMGKLNGVKGREHVRPIRNEKTSK